MEWDGGGGGGGGDRKGRKHFAKATQPTLGREGRPSTGTATKICTARFTLLYSTTAYCYVGVGGRGTVMSLCGVKTHQSKYMRFILRLA